MVDQRIMEVARILELLQKLVEKEIHEAHPLIQTYVQRAVLF